MRQEESPKSGQDKGFGTKTAAGASLHDAPHSQNRSGKCPGMKDGIQKPWDEFLIRMSSEQTGTVRDPP